MEGRRETVIAFRQGYACRMAGYGKFVCPYRGWWGRWCFVFGYECASFWIDIGGRK